jgi:predicted MFS family arabinose efflux permease
MGVLDRMSARAQCAMARLAQRPPLPVSLNTPNLPRARRSVRLQFALLGLLVGTWGAHIPSVKARHGIDEATLSLVLLAAAVGTVLSLFIAGRVVGRLGARGAAAAAGLTMGLLLAAVLVLPSVPVLVPAALLLGGAMSLFDVAINTQGSALEALAGRPIMSNLHGMFSVGGMAGAGSAAALLAAGVPASAQLPGVGLLVALAALAAARGMLPDPSTGPGGADAPPDTRARFAWPRGLLLVIGVLLFAGMSAEGVMYDWCVLYLQQDVGLSQAQAAVGYAVFSGAMALARFAGDTLRARYSETALLGAGGGLAALAMAGVLLSAHPAVAMVGFALAGAGLAPVAPILFNAATRVPGVSPAAAIAAVTSVGYSGFMLGPPLIGSIAAATSLTVALWLVVLMSGLLAAGARWVPAR